MNTVPSTEPGIDRDVIRNVQFHLRHRYLSPMEGHALYYLVEQSQGENTTLTIEHMAQGLGRSQCRCRSYLRQLSRVGLITKQPVSEFEYLGTLTYRLLPMKPTDTEAEPVSETTHLANEKTGYAENHTPHVHTELRADLESAPRQRSVG